MQGAPQPGRSSVACLHVRRPGLGAEAEGSPTLPLAEGVGEVIIGVGGGVDCLCASVSLLVSCTYYKKSCDLLRNLFPHYLYKNIKQYCIEACGDNGEATEIVRRMILVALCCIQTMPDDRPSMSRVVNMLEGDISDLQLPPKP
uniref:Uncharacterized protein n=1 Tax=Ananas comosus var. bracteatus TaxID=296719 RepID=A0A6V7NY84_ANACO|nr:unnamed protein product [Ananas comosus var. bracteatus]